MKTISRIVAAFVLAAPLAAMTAGPLYPPVERAAADVEAALKEAAKTHRRVIVDFGGDWCTDCRILDINLKRPENAALVDRHFVVARVNVGAKGISDNFAIAERFGVPLRKGVPALAVLEGDGRVVYAQKNGEFESMRRMDPQSVNDFLEKWRGR